MRSAAFHLALASAALTTTSLVACRQEPIQETVYTGRRAVPQPTLPDVGTVTPTVTIDAGQPAEPFTKAALLREIGDCQLELLQDFEVRARTLREATAALAATPSPATTDAARTAWREAIALWQELEVFRLGPAASRTAPGGLGLRDQIYGWPLVNACKIDEQLVSRSYAEPGFATSLINGRGLGAVERTLFYEGNANACGDFSVINANGTWAALSGDELARRRRDYAAAAAALIAARATELLTAWSPSGGDFYGAFTQAGAGSALFASEQAALNTASDALFYVEVEVKDLKLGRPIGLSDCAAPPCVGLVESPWSQASTAHVQANLRGFRRLFSGCSAGVGFDDWLEAAGAGELAGRMTSALGLAISTANAVTEPLDVALTRDPAALSVLYAAVKGVTDPLKTELTGVLDLELPMTVEGDND